jgi:phenylpropionate dioxygenase-like ring-hydroxylating dioxygenase large terminal subunit
MVFRMSAALRENSRPDVRRVGLNPDHWFPLADAAALAPGGIARAQFVGEPIAIVRSASGRVFALEDRCPHRQFPLHRGVVEGEALRCGYHGWRFGANGACLEATGLKRPPLGIRPRAYPAREAHGWIFVFPGDPERAERTPLPEVAGLAQPGSRSLRYAGTVGCHYSFLLENLMDMTHQFLHRKRMGHVQAEICGVQESERAVEVDYRFRQERDEVGLGAKLLLRLAHAHDGEIARVRVRSEYPYQSLEVRRPGREEPSLRMWASYWPTDRSQKRSELRGIVVVPPLPVPGLFSLIRPVIRHFTDSIFAEDRSALEAEQNAYDTQGGDWNREVNPVVFRLQDLVRRHGLPLAD